MKVHFTSGHTLGCSRCSSPRFDRSRTIGNNPQLTTMYDDFHQRCVKALKELQDALDYEHRLDLFHTREQRKVLADKVNREGGERGDECRGVCTFSPVNVRCFSPSPSVVGFRFVTSRFRFRSRACSVLSTRTMQLCWKQSSRLPYRTHPQKHCNQRRGGWKKMNK
jgi:hypothetical protein